MIIVYFDFGALESGGKVYHFSSCGYTVFLSIMDKFLVRPGPSKRRNDDENGDTKSEPLPKRRAISGGSTSISKYKQNLIYDPSWKNKHPWMNVSYDNDSSQVSGIICTICKAFGNPPVQARGAWVSRPINNWVKATSLLKKHELSEWHLASGGKRHSHILLLSKEMLFSK